RRLDQRGRKDLLGLLRGDTPGTDRFCHGTSDLVLIISDKHQIFPGVLLPGLPRDPYHQLPSSNGRVIVNAARAGRLEAPGVGLALSLLPSVSLRPEG